MSIAMITPTKFFHVKILLIPPDFEQIHAFWSRFIRIIAHLIFPMCFIYILWIFLTRFNKIKLKR